MVAIPRPSRTNICAVIVTYHPDAAFESRVLRILPQVAHIVVVDNASSADSRRPLDELCARGVVELVLLEENLGIGAALNRGLELAIARGFTWGLTFDQDSVADDALVSKLLEVYADYPDADRTAIIGANYEEETTGTTGTPKRARRAGTSWIEVDEVITSGCLQSLAVFRDIGPYREDLFIYFVDNEFCKRARVAGYRVILSRTPLILHRTGSTARHRWLHRDFVTPHYAPWRHYYIVRNGIVLVARYWSADPKWGIRRVRSIVKRSIAVLVFENERVEKFAYMMRGAYDGVRGRTGKLPAA